MNYGQTVQIWSALIVASLIAGLLVFFMTFLESNVRKRMGGEITGIFIDGKACR